MNLHRSLLPALLSALVAVVATSPTMVRADDTDLYVNPNFRGGTASGSIPLVMFSIDYRSNLGSSICSDASSASCAEAEYFRSNEATKASIDALGSNTLTFFHVIAFSLRAVFAEFSGFKGGIMINHANQNNCSGPQASNSKCSNGGYIMLGFTEMNEAGRETFLDKLEALPIPQGNLAHDYQGAELFFEFYRYIKGFPVWNGLNGWTDYGSNNTKNIGQAGDAGELVGYDTSIITTGTGDGTYISPIGANNQCTKIFTINFMFQVSNQDSHSDTEIAKSEANYGMGFTPTNNRFPEVVAKLRDSDLSTADGEQRVLSYFVTANNNITTRSYATAGGTQLATLSDDPSELVLTLKNILREILSVSTTFVSASVPVNVFNRSESLDNVFIALFQADKDGNPFWVGNMKKLKLKANEETGGIELVDISGANAIGNDGRIRFDAVTFWTDPDQLPAATAGTGEVDGADGRVVDRGAAGQKVTGFLAGDPGLSNGAGARKLFYDPVASSGALSELNATAAVATDLVDDFGLGADTTTALNVIKWARGYDPAAGAGAVRDWWFGDPLHSRPLPINYGRSGGHTSDPLNPLIYIAVGANDGVMRFVRNTVDGMNSSPDINTHADAGREVWAFMPRAVMPAVTTQYAGGVGIKHPYGVDGAPASFSVDINNDGTIDPTVCRAVGDCEAVYLYFGLRRGGRAMYALNVTDPENPTLAWRIENTTAGFSELGYTFSTPRVGSINRGSGTEPVVIFAGGYDLNKDDRDIIGTDDTYGNALYVVNAKTGALIWKATKGASTGVVSASQFAHANLTDSIPSDIAIADADGDGYTDRILVGDTGGQVWRADIAGATSNWRVTRLANLGRHWSNTITQDRRFFHRPDLVPSKDDAGPYDAVVIGSGNRENPLDRSGDSTDADTAENWMYMIKDRKISAYVAGDAHPTVVQHEHVTDGLADITDNCLGSGDCAIGDLQPEIGNGWRLKLEVGPGEKSLSSPVTVTNTVFFTTFLPLGTKADLTTQLDADGNPLPEVATCGPQEGKGILYAINLADGTPSTNFNVKRDGTETDPGDASDRYSELASAGIPADVVGVSLGGQAYVLPPDLKPEAIQASTRWRTFWYQVEDDDN